MILDTCFLIDLQRGRAETAAFLQANVKERLCITAISLGEFASGVTSNHHPTLLANLAHFDILDLDSDAALVYGRLYQSLKAVGRMIGTNDLWIASIALAHRMPVVTNNVADFTRVPGLMVLGY